MVEQTGFSASGETHGESGVLTTPSFFRPPNQHGCELSFSLCNSNKSQKGASAPPAGFYEKYASKYVQHVLILNPCWLVCFSSY